MDHSKKLDFIHKMSKLGLDHIQRFESGGEVHTQGGGILQPIGDFLGLNNKFQAGSADIQAGTTQKQLDAAYSGTQNALTNQNNLTTTLTPQASQAVQQQNNLAGQLSDMTQGKGPNPAIAQLNRATAANTANQAALMAGQRGAATNPGLIARQAAMQGATNQQNAIGQAATLQAQQQIEAQKALAGLSANQLSQTGQSISNQNQFQQNEQGVLQNANTAANNAAVNMQSNINNANAMTAAGNQQAASGLFGQLQSGLGGALAGIFGAEGGEVGVDIDPNKYADGGEAVDSVPSFVANFLNPASSASTAPLSQPAEIQMAAPKPAEEKKSGIEQLAPIIAMMAAAEGGEVPALLSKGERFLDPDEAKKVAGGEASPLKIGKKVPGTPRYPGNDYRNDVVPAKLEEGGIVIPNKILQGKNPEKKAIEFVRATLAKSKQGLRRKKA